MYIRKEFKTRSGHIVDFEFSNVDIECQYLEVIFDKQRNVLIVNIYRPLQGNITDFVKHRPTF